MAKVKIFSPNTDYTGMSASVAFSNGVGETDDEHLINWFKEHNYTVVEQDTEVKTVEKTLDQMTVEELIVYAKENGIDIGKATSQSGIIEKIKAAQSSSTTDTTTNTNTDANATENTSESK